MLGMEGSSSTSRVMPLGRVWLWTAIWARVGRVQAAVAQARDATERARARRFHGCRIDDEHHTA